MSQIRRDKERKKEVKMEKSKEIEDICVDLVWSARSSRLLSWRIRASLLYICD